VLASFVGDIPDLDLALIVSNLCFDTATFFYVLVCGFSSLEYEVNAV
jgi:hypothetical protein